MDSITITKQQLHAALEQWERDARDGKTFSADEAAKMSVEDVVSASTDALWEQLQAGEVQ